VKLKSTTLAAALLLGACTTVTNETRTPAVVQDGFYAGERYEIRQQQVEGPNGPYERTSVVYRGVARGCIKDSPKDCEVTAKALIEAYDESLFGF